MTRRGPADHWYYVFGPPPEQARLTLLCLPCAGGSAAMYAPWGDRLPSDICIAAARLPGREARLAEPAFAAMPDFVAAFVPTLRRLAQRPYAIFGHSMGALMGYALMQAHGATLAPPAALFLSAHRPPHLDLGRPALHDEPKEEFLAAVRRMGGIPDEVWRHRDLLDVIEPAMRADFRLCETYPHGAARRDDPYLTMPVYVYGGRDDETATPDSLARWADLCTDLRDVNIRSGGHFYLRRHQDALLADIAAALAPTAGGARRAHA